MQMYMFVTEVLQKSKYLYPPGQPFPDTPLGCPRHLRFFSLSAHSPVVGQGKFHIDNAPLRPKPVKAAFGRNVDQSKPDSHFNSQIDPYISCILIECVCSKMQHKCLGGTQYPAPGGTYQV